MAGRPTEYSEEYNEQAYKLCLLGCTDAELGEFFEVTEQTINNWKTEHPEFFESIKKGKAIADVEVAKSLHERATGWSKTYVEEVLTKEGVVVALQKTAIQPPDPVSMIFWLKNRKPSLWRDKSEQDHNHKGLKIIINPSEGDEPISE